MSRKRYIYYVVSLFAVIFLLSCSREIEKDPLQSETLRISVVEANKILGQDNVVFIDVRSIADWNNSSRKIRGSVRKLYKEFDSWAHEYKPSQKLIFYCS